MFSDEKLKFCVTDMSTITSTFNEIMSNLESLGRDSLYECHYMNVNIKLRLRLSVLVAKVEPQTEQEREEQTEQMSFSKQTDLICCWKQTIKVNL